MPGRQQGPGEVPGLRRYPVLADRILESADTPADALRVAERSLAAHRDPHERLPGGTLTHQGRLEDRQRLAGLARVQEGLREAAGGAEIAGALCVAVSLSLDPAESPSAV